MDEGGPRRRPRLAVVVIVAFVVVVGAVALVAAFGGGDASTAVGGTLRSVDPGNRGGGVRMPGVPVGQSWNWTTVEVCSTKGSSTITAITPISPKGPGHFTVTDWAVQVKQYNEPLNDGTPGRARNLPGYRNQPITALCGSTSGTNLAIGVVLNGGAAAGSDEFMVHWKNGNRTGQFRIPFELTECTGTVCPRHLTLYG